MGDLPRVRFLVNSFLEGGTERQAVLLANALHRSNAVRMSIDTLDTDGPLAASLEAELRQNVGRYPLTGFATSGALKALLVFAKSLRRDRITILHTHGFYPNVFGMLAGVLAGVPVRIASKRESVALRPAPHRRLERLAFSLATRLLANCDAVREELIASGIAPDRVVVVPNAIDPSRIQELGAPDTTTPQTTQARALAPGIDEFRLVMVANFHHAAKDHTTLLRALQHVVRACPAARLTLVGRGPRRQEVAALVHELGLDRHVNLADHQRDVPAVLAQADMGVLSSRHEGLPNVILEYMAAGLPVVATDAGGTREVVLDGVTGWIVQPGDAQAMGEAILRACSDPVRAKQMGAAGRVRVLSHFTVEQLVARTLALYARECSARVSRLL